jgi:hypothetical protein
MLNWNEYRNQLFGRVAELSRPSHDTVAGYPTLSAAAARFDDKITEIEKMHTAYGAPLPAEQVESLARSPTEINGKQ